MTPGRGYPGGNQHQCQQRSPEAVGDDEWYIQTVLVSDGMKDSQKAESGHTRQQKQYRKECAPGDHQPWVPPDSKAYNAAKEKIEPQEKKEKVQEQPQGDAEEAEGEEKKPQDFLSGIAAGGGDRILRMGRGAGFRVGRSSIRSSGWGQGCGAGAGAGQGNFPKGGIRILR